MPEYDYQCPECKKVIEAKRIMAHRNVVPECPDCKVRTKRIITQMPAVNWGGLRPSQGELAPIIQDMVDHEEENRDNYFETKENYEKETTK